jgi:hypothetical protein
MTLNWARDAAPNCVEIATSAASRPRAITMRPMRGTLCRASNVLTFREKPTGDCYYAGI